MNVTSLNTTTSQSLASQPSLWSTPPPQGFQERLAASSATSGPSNVSLVQGTNPPVGPNYVTFITNPLAFASNYFINTLHNFVPPGTQVPPPRANQVVDGNNNIVGFTLQPNPNTPNTADMVVTGTPGSNPNAPTSAFAYYLPFSSDGPNSISVPAHPAAGQPNFVVTGGFTGCSFYARPDPNNPNNIIFTHDPVNGRGDSTTSPDGIPSGAVGTSWNRYAAAGQANSSATNFAYYDPNRGQWVIAQQNAIYGNADGTVGGNTQPDQRPVDAEGNVDPNTISGAQIPVQFDGATTSAGPPGGTLLPGEDGPPTTAPTDPHDEGLGFFATVAAGAGTGAAIGAVAGSEVPGLGNLTGAGAGALVGGFTAGGAWLFDYTGH